VYDTATGKEVVRTAEGQPARRGAKTTSNTMSAMIAIDAGVAYWHDGTGVKAYDIAAGTMSTVMDGAGANWLDDVENGVLAHQLDLHYRGDAGAADHRRQLRAPRDAARFQPVEPRLPAARRCTRRGLRRRPDTDPRRRDRRRRHAAYTDTTRSRSARGSTTTTSRSSRSPVLSRPASTCWSAASPPRPAQWRRVVSRALARAR